MTTLAVHRPQVRSVRCDGPAESVDLSSLSATERERASRFRHATDRDRFLRRRVALRHILAGQTDRDPRDLVFETNRFGKLRLAERPDLHFSVSTSADVALVAFGSRPLGIDVEAVVRMRDTAAVAHAFFAAEERRRIVTTGDFYRCWTRKEAYLKALGTGLATPLESFAVEVADVPQPGLRTGDTVVGPQVSLFDLSALHSGFAAALAVLRHDDVASPDHVPSPEHEEWTFDDL